MPRYKVTLELEEREHLEQLTRKGKIAAAKLMHVRALLLCDQGEHNGELKDTAKALGVSTRTIEKLKKRFVEEGLESAIERKPSTRRPNIKFDGEFDRSNYHGAFDQFMGFKETLEDFYNRPVDLLASKKFRNPIFEREVEDSKV